MSEIDLKGRLAAGKFLTLKERADRKALNKRIRDIRLAKLKKKVGDVKPRHAGLSDLPETQDPVGAKSRVRWGGYVAPAIELNSLRPAQVGPGNPWSGEPWYMRACPILIVRPEDAELRTLPDGTVEAHVQPVISWPYEPEYHHRQEFDFVSTRAFNSSNPNLSMDAACRCFYGEVDLDPPDVDADDDEEIDEPIDPGGLGDGTINLPPGVYDEKLEDEALLRCNNPRTLNMPNFVAEGRIVIFPHPAADRTVIRLYIHDANKRLIEVFVRYVASRNIFSATSPTYGTTHVGIDDHHIPDAGAFSHAVRPGSGGSGAQSGSDISSLTAIGRDARFVAPGAGPAIIDVTAMYPMTVSTPGGGRLVTQSAWGTRIR